MTSEYKKVLIIGTGSIGKRHYKIFNDFLYCDTYIKSSSYKREKYLENKGYKIFRENLKYDIGIIATTSDKHLSNITNCKQLCSKWLIEKPIISIYDFKPNLVIDLEIQQKSFVGYNKRFEKGIIELKSYLRNLNISGAKFKCFSNLEFWRNQPLNESISLDRLRGGGVLNELSHEIDLASFLIGSIDDINGEVYQKRFTNSNVEDSASLSIKHKSGINSFVEISFASLFEERMIEIKTENEEIFYDHLTGIISNKFQNLSKKNIIQNTKEERNKSFIRQAEALIYNKHNDLCTFNEGLDLINKIYHLKWLS